MSLQQASEFLNQHQTCVLTTVKADGTPQAATVGFSHNEKFVILIGTNKNSRKYQNLIDRPNIALVVGVEGAKTVQLEGIAKEVSPSEERLNAHYTKVPGAKKFKDQAGQTYFEITPIWLRFTDYTVKNPVFETRNFSE